MGRGLSPLQKYILVAALDKATRSHRDVHVLRSKDVMVGYYGFAPRDPEYSYSKQSSHDFCLSEIGERRYRSAAVAIRKAFSRLERRGLARFTKYHWYKFDGLELTPQGEEIATMLSSETLLSVPSLAGSPPRR